VTYPLPRRLADKIEAVSGNCWWWLASDDGSGYGAFWWDGHMSKAHRVVYELLVGPVSSDLELDHLCRNRRCVNPDHLEPVTHRTNSMRGLTGAHNKHKTHCPQGHAYTAENTYYVPSNPGSRYCQACNVERSRLRRARDRKMTRIMGVLGG